MDDLTAHDAWVVSGSLCGWGDVAIPHFELVVFLWIPQDIRMERLRQRELARFGERMLPGGDMYETSQAFLAWAASYDEGGVDIRSRQRHDQWLSTLPCPILCFEGAYSIEEQLAVLMVEIQPQSGDAFARPLMSLRTITSTGLAQGLIWAHLSSIFLQRSVVVLYLVSSHEGTSCVTSA